MDKGPVGRILYWTKFVDFFIRRLGIILLCKIKVLKVELLKFLHKWLSFAQNYVVQKMGPKENTQSNHMA